MQLKDLVWIAIIMAISAFIAVPATRNLFVFATMQNPYLMGFTKTAILATMGELLVNRMRRGGYFAGIGIAMKFIVWGLLGMVFVLMFPLFSAGVTNLQQSGLLPAISGAGWVSILLTALLTSVLINLVFAPSFMILHRITDTYIELAYGRLTALRHIRMTTVINHIDWTHFFGFVVFKTIPLFWIPAHTITFMLPPHFRVLMAACLSIALGVILTIAKRQNNHDVK